MGGFFNFWQALAYIGVLAGMLARAKSAYPGKQVRTILVVENPDSTLTVEEVQTAIGGKGLAFPGFTVTP